MYETVNLDMNRTHGTISTVMGSPILGNPDAPITIVEFGDYQCHQCYNWFHNTKPAIKKKTTLNLEKQIWCLLTWPF